MDDDYDDYDYYRRPKLQLASGVVRSSEEDNDAGLSQGAKAAHASVGVAFVAIGLCTPGTVQFVALWLALGFLVGPFAPRRVTGGDCRVGVGEDVVFEAEDEEEEEEAGELAASALTKRSPAVGTKAGAGALQAKGKLPVPSAAAPAAEQRGAAAQLGKGGWFRDEWDQMRKLLVKFPRGTPQRWEAVARALGTKRSTEEIMKVSKFLQECSDKDPYASFVAQNGLPPAPEANSNRPVPDGAVPASSPLVDAGGAEGDVWSPAQDKALLQALKKCPKDTPQRWDRITEAVPEKSKADCVRRYSELKNSFKASKKANETGEVVGLD